MSWDENELYHCPLCGRFCSYAGEGLCEGDYEGFKDAYHYNWWVAESGEKLQSGCIECGNRLAEVPCEGHTYVGFEMPLGD